MNETTFRADGRGLVMGCPQCGQANRLLYERLGRQMRCGHCKGVLSPPGAPMEIGGENEFGALVGSSALPVLVDFWAPWCGPCKMVAPELIKVAQTGAGRWLVVKVNTEELPRLASQFGIQSIPTLVLLWQGRELARQSGAMPAAAIVRFIEGAIQ